MTPQPPPRQPQDLRLRTHPGSTRLMVLRSIIVMAACGYFLSKALHPILLPHGSPVAEPPARDPSVPWYASRTQMTQRYQNALRFRHQRTYQIRAPGLHGCETVLVWQDRVFCLTEAAQLLELTDLPTKAQEQALLQNNHYMWNATSVVRKDLGIGRPLGGRIHQNTLYITDAVLGVTQLQQFDRPESSTVELLTNQVSVLKKVQKRDTFYTPVTSPLVFANSLAVGPVTHKIYFTDSTDIPPDRIGKKDQSFVWDLLYASKMDLARGKAAGRLCEYNPATGVTRVLADHIRFANGIAVDPVNEEYLVVAESVGINVLKYHLNDSIKQSVDLLTPEEYLQPEVLVTSLPGYVDNVDCVMVPGKRNSTTKCFVAIVAEVAAVHVVWRSLPYVFQKFIRTVIMIWPRSWLPEFPSRYTGILVVDPVSGEQQDFIQDPSGQDISLLTGVTVSPKQDKLYLGSLHNDYVGVYLLSGASAKKDGKTEESDSSATDMDEL